MRIVIYFISCIIYALYIYISCSYKSICFNFVLIGRLSHYDTIVVSSTGAASRTIPKAVGTYKLVNSSNDGDSMRYKHTNEGAIAMYLTVDKNTPWRVGRSNEHT